jgi:hypothetical protein
METQAPSALLALHVALGFAGFVLGAVAIVLPKFGRTSRRHAWTGRAYAVCMLGMALLSVPLALSADDRFLLVIGLLTLGWTAGGWIALRRALRARGIDRPAFARMIRLHIILMGSSYIAAWTAFLVNVRPLGGAPLLLWVYVLAPTVIGSILISRSAGRFVPAPGTTRNAAITAAGVGIR